MEKVLYCFYKIFRLDSRIPRHSCVTLPFCSRSPAVDEYLHKETKEKCVYSSFFKSTAGVRGCGSTSSTLINIYYSFFSITGVRDCGSTSSTPIKYSFFSLRECRTAGALVLHKCNILFCILK